MEMLLLEILDRLREGELLEGRQLDRMIRTHNRGLKGSDQFAKKQLLPFYLDVKQTDSKRWQGWSVNPELEERLLRTLRVKPRRSASGVATITVITKPWKCTSNCLFCPNDVRMPKSYLSDEPACQRAERNFFDPYLQVASRLKTLTEMGHATDKIEMIVLGGTWTDYPLNYQVWFIKEMFRALNEADFEVNSTQLVRSGVVQQTGSRVADRFAYYVEKGLSYLEPEIASAVEDVQSLVNNRALTYNQAIEQLYLQNETWQSIAFEQRAELDELFVEQFANETALHRVVGLAVEIRPDAVTVENLLRLRQLGCTKIQMGIQSLDEQILKANDRKVSLAKIQEAFGLLRVFGFKIHAHFMLNLYRSSPQTDILDYQRFVAEQQFCPDEVKLYPCALVESARLIDNYRDGSWQPYSEAELLEVLAADTLNTPAYVRISRMIRDFSATDIVAGNKKTNFRQMVEERIGQMGESIHEIRYREISTSEVDVEELVLDTIVYDTTVSKECFLQWVTPDNRIVGFLRLSLPDPVYVEELAGKFLELPIKPNEAMIREVHIYGQAVRLHQTGEGAQHLGLGRKLIDEAIRISLVHGYRKLNVISSVGTREYYRELGFYDNGLYQQKEL